MAIEKSNVDVGELRRRWARQDFTHNRPADHASVLAPFLIIERHGEPALPPMWVAAIDLRPLRHIVPIMAAGWNVRVTTFDSEGKPGIVRNFLAYEADRERAIELVRKRVPVYAGELAEAVAEAAADELIGQRMKPGDVRLRD
jgi:hypothetical protein